MSSDKNRFLTGQTDLWDKSDRLERAEGNGEIQKRGSRVFDEKRV